MAQRQNRPGDFTGQAKAKLAKEHADEVAKRDGEISMMADIEAKAAENRVTDYTKGADSPVVIDDPDVVAAAEEMLRRQSDADSVTTIDDVHVVGDEPGTLRQAPARTIRINSTLESVTIGAGNHYTFNEGEKYTVPAHVAEHLESKGYVWH
jgi:hypothetical protein